MPQLTRVGFLSTHGGSIPIPPSAGAPPDFQANTVNFDGTNDYLTRDAALTGTVDSKTGLFSVWLNPNTDGIFGNIFTGSDGTNLDFQIARNATNLFQILCKQTDGATTTLLVRTVNTLLAAGGYYNVLCSWNLATATAQIYVNDISDADTPVTLIDAIIDYTMPDWFVGAGEAAAVEGTQKFSGDIAELYFEPGTFLDLSVEANRRKFITADCKPVNLGVDGSIPTGSSPIVFLSGTTDSWHTNKGTGGGFTEIGALTDGTTPVEC